MTEMSLKYTLSTQDFLDYNKNAMKPNRLKTLMKFILMISVVGLLAIAVDGYIVGIITGAILICIMLLTPFAVRQNAKRIFLNSYQSKTGVTVDFYDDHIVEKIEGYDTVGIDSEIHFPLEIFVRAEETQTLFILYISPLEALVIPKRVMSAEETEKMNNLLCNIFHSSGNI